MRHQLLVALGAAVCAVLTGTRSYVAIAEWAHDLPEAVRRRLGIERDPPSESAFRPVLQAIDPHLLDSTVCGWLASRRTVDAQRWRAIAVDGKSNEITGFAPLLDSVELADVLVTADALHTQREHAEYLIGRGARYLFIVKGYQPTLRTQLKTLPWRDIPAVVLDHGKGHGRAESRSMKITAVSVGIGFPPRPPPPRSPAATGR